MNPLTISAGGFWALLIRLQAAMFVPVVLGVLGFAYSQVERINRLEKAQEGLSQWKAQYVNYPFDANDLGLRFTSKLEGQLVTMAVQMQALSTTIVELKTEIKQHTVKQ